VVTGQHVLTSLCYMPIMIESPVTTLAITVSGGGDVDDEDLARQKAALESDASMLRCSAPTISLQESSGQHLRRGDKPADASDQAEWFKTADQDADGELDFDEWMGLLAPIGDGEEKARELFDEVDEDHNGRISMQEYVDYVDSVPPSPLKPLGTETKQKVSPITNETHSYEVDTVEMPLRGAYARLSCDDACPGAIPHYTVNSPQVGETSPRPADNLVPLTFGINYIRAVCENSEMRVSPIASREVLLVPPGQCLPGSTGPGMPDCEECAPGTFKPEGGNVPCALCGAGMTSPAGSKDETECECKPGYRPKGSGAMCVTCEAGTYKELAGEGACLPCGENSASPAGSTSPDECECNAGYSPDAEEGFCAACLPGTYKDALGPEACSACPAHSASVEPASTFQTDCLCAPGYHGASGKLPYVASPDGSVQRLPSPDPEDFPTYGDSDGPLCLPCPAGTYKEEAGGYSESACVVCPEGSTSAEASASASACVPCDGPCPAPSSAPDAAGSTAPDECPVGSAILLGSTYTSASDCKCEPGFTGPDGGPCVACEPGKFKALYGAEPCDTCPEHTSSPEASVTHIDCVCLEGFGGLPGGPCTSPAPPPPAEPNWRETGVSRACTLNGKACWYRSHQHDCFTDEGQVCKYEGLQFLNMPGINWKPPGHPEHVQMALTPRPNKQNDCDCLVIPVNENLDFFSKFLD